MTWIVKEFPDEDLIQIWDGENFVIDTNYFLYRGDNCQLADRISQLPDFVELIKRLADLESYPSEDTLEHFRQEAKNLLRK